MRGMRHHCFESPSMAVPGRPRYSGNPSIAVPRIHCHYLGNHLVVMLGTLRRYYENPSIVGSLFLFGCKNEVQLSLQFTNNYLLTPLAQKFNISRPLYKPTKHIGRGWNTDIVTTLVLTQNGYPKL